MTHSTPVPPVGDPVYPDAYYERLAELLGDEKAAWARLPYAERMKELDWLHAHFNTPDDLAECPPELDGGVGNP
jgi:hypothetical protein